MGRTKGSLGKKTLEKLGKLPAVEINSNDMFSEVAEATKSEVGPQVDIVKNSVEDKVISPSDTAPKKRGRKPGSKNKSTVKEIKNKQNFSSDEEDNGDKKTGDEINNLETYYRIAVEDKTKLEKRLIKETSPNAISFIKSTLVCININIERFKSKMGGVVSVIGEDEEMSGDEVKE